MYYEYKEGIKLKKRKEYVIETARNIFNDKGYSTASIQDIIEGCNISKGTFYNYFSSKNEFLIDYIKSAIKDEKTQRETLLIGEELTNKTVLAKQILVRIEINETYKLRPIIEEAIHSNDETLITFIKTNYKNELNWLALRLLDIYGEEYTKYIYDCAVIMHGIMHNMTQIWKMLSNKKINNEGLVDYTLRRIDAIVLDVKTQDDSFIQAHNFNFLVKQRSTDVSLDDINKQLNSINEALIDNNHLSKEYITFITQEINSKEPRVLILRSIVETLYKSLLDNDLKDEFISIIIDMRVYLSKY